MNTNAINSQVFQEKNNKIEQTRQQLKQEFFGIDRQIDQIVDLFRNWYIFPNLMDKPIIVNLFGMTGVGKTHLIHRLVQLMEIENDYIYINFSEIEGFSTFNVELDFEGYAKYKKNNPVIVYDEFQAARTLDENGSERDKREGLRPFWELLDTGVLHQNSVPYQTNKVRVVYETLDWVLKRFPNFDYENGIWKNQEECLKSMTDFERATIKYIFNINKTAFDATSLSGDASRSEKGAITNNSFDRDLITGGLFTESMFEAIRCTYQDMYSSTITTIQFADLLYHKSLKEIIDFCQKLYNLALKGIDYDFKHSMIFVLANLDEAYTLSGDLNPDITPDHFNKLTQKINIIDIKKALQRRFRNEQIGRLGNIHVIYPSFTTQAFKEIIQKELRVYAEKIKKLLGLNITFDDTISHIIFKEGVFPTQGARPIFSTIYDLLKTKLPIIVNGIYLDGLENSVDSAVISYKAEQLCVSLLDETGKEVKKIFIPHDFRLENLRKNKKDENQAITALHESGHFVVHMALIGTYPDKIVSVTPDSSIGGFMLPEIDKKPYTTKSSIINNICVGLGGYCAEKLIFGKDDRTIGASHDLEVITQYAVSMVRCYGLVYPYVTTKQNVDADKFVCDDDQQYIADTAKEIIRECVLKVENILNDVHYRKLLKESALYLSTHNLMKQHTMKRLYIANIPKENRVQPKDNDFYRQKVRKL